MILPGFPLPMINGGASGPEITFGSIDVTIANYAGSAFGFSQGQFGARANDTLITVEGEGQSIGYIYSFSGSNFIKIECDDDPTAVILRDFFSANTRYLQDAASGATFVLELSGSTNDGRTDENVEFTFTTSDLWTAAEAGQTRTLQIY